MREPQPVARSLGERRPSATQPSSSEGIGQLHYLVSLISVALSLMMLFIGGPRSLHALGGLTAVGWLWCLWRGWRAPPLRSLHPAVLLLAVGAWYPLATDLVVFLIGVVVGLTLARFTSLQRAQSFTQLYILSFAQVTLSAQLEGGLSYGLLLACYMVMITVSLTLNHLRAHLELEPDPRRLTRRLSSARLLPGRFIWGVGLIATLLCGLSLALFFMLPRVGGQWFHGYQRGGGVAGFSDEVELGAVNSIQKDQRVAFRVTFSRPSPRSPLLVGSPLNALEVQEPEHPERLLPASERYWVGRRLDRYQAGRWSHRAPNIAQRFAPQLSPLQGDTHWLSSPTLYSEGLRARLIWQEIFLEPRGHQALFTLSEPLALVLPRATPVRPLKVTEDLSVQYRWEGGFRYQVLSLKPLRAPLLSASLARYRSEAERTPTYASLTQLPEALEPKLRSLASPIVASAQSVEEVASLLSAHLQRAHAYSLEGLEVQAEGLDPVLAFLEEGRAGHCEYFSTALALMLRALGIPARVVTGYHGGEWNEYGRYLTVYQRDAHAWVELWAGGDPLLPSSWERVDPTPSRQGGQARTELWSQWLDQLEFAWLRYVIGFEAQDQVRALQSAEGEVSAWLLSLKRWWLNSGLRLSLLSLSAELRSGLHSLSSVTGWALLLVCALLYHRRKRASRERRSSAGPVGSSELQRASSALYIQALKACERAGLVTEDSSTSAELVRALERRSTESSIHFVVLTARYERLRFGPSLPEGGERELEELRSLVAQLERSLSSEASASGDEPS